MSQIVKKRAGRVVRKKRAGLLNYGSEQFKRRVEFKVEHNKSAFRRKQFPEIALDVKLVTEILERAKTPVQAIRGINIALVGSLHGAFIVGPKYFNQSAFYDLIEPKISLHDSAVTALLAFSKTPEELNSCDCILTQANPANPENYWTCSQCHKRLCDDCSFVCAPCESTLCGNPECKKIGVGLNNQRGIFTRCPRCPRGAGCWMMNDEWM